eukprot:710879-Hanusia_phi.AAC.1
MLQEENHRLYEDNCKIYDDCQNLLHQLEEAGEQRERLARELIAREEEISILHDSLQHQEEWQREQKGSTKEGEQADAEDKLEDMARTVREFFDRCLPPRSFAKGSAVVLLDLEMSFYDVQGEEEEFMDELAEDVAAA